MDCGSVVRRREFPLPVIEGLRRLGHDVVTMHDPATVRQFLTDEAVLDLASTDYRAVLTLNRPARL
ncbi:MAG: DUF5615 family PIN-like protein [bacterium]|uniref:DUF5615 family PIN-like protein n=1 Tax=Candidatus Methylomirabilis tolerans TaxID=3123416 RepID=A0AAJ1AIC1_9BACT|nr:DUF5615 family PIN-like protein [Candidatus Methylomirabilis sp.]